MSSLCRLHKQWQNMRFRYPQCPLLRPIFILFNFIPSHDSDDCFVAAVPACRRRYLRSDGCSCAGLRHRHASLSVRSDDRPGSSAENPPRGQRASCSLRFALCPRRRGHHRVQGSSAERMVAYRSRYFGLLHPGHNDNCASHPPCHEVKPYPVTRLSTSCGKTFFLSSFTPRTSSCPSPRCGCV